MVLFSNFEIIPRSRPQHEGGSETFRKDVIDLKTPREIASYDKRGCRSMIRSLKYHYFGDAGCRMTKKRCEEFFENDSNFKI